MRKLFRPVLVLLAFFFLFEAWLWERLAPMVAWIVARIPLEGLKARIAGWIAALPPGATLILLIVPFSVLVPLKFLEFWFLAHRNWLGVVATLVAAKLVGLGVTAFIFDLTRDKLLQMPWFRRLYDLVLMGLAWAHGLIDPIKRRLRLWLYAFSPKRAGRTLRLFARMRRRIQAA